VAVSSALSDIFPLKFHLVLHPFTLTMIIFI